MPDDFKKCKGIVAAWGLGGDPFYFPPEAGYPVGEEHGGATYYMLEIHYDNPGRKSEQKYSGLVSWLLLVVVWLLLWLQKNNIKIVEFKPFSEIFSKVKKVHFVFIKI